MTKFGARLQAERREELAEGYLRYDELKTLLRPEATPPITSEAFEEKLRAEIKRIYSFSEQKRKALLARLDALEEKWKNVSLWKTSGFSESDALVEETYAACATLLRDLDAYIDFTALNLLGVQKLVKKFERFVGGAGSHLLTTLTQREEDELNLLSNVRPMEQLSKRARNLFNLIQVARKRNGNGNQVIEFQVRPHQDYHSISGSTTSASSPPRSHASSTLSLDSYAGTQSRVASQKTAQLQLQQQQPMGWLDALAAPLLASECLEEDELDVRSPVLVAALGALLAGIGLGAFWTICEVLLTPKQTALALLLASFGAITGTRLMAFSKHHFMYISALVGGAGGSYLFAYTAMPLDAHAWRLLLSAWLVGNMFGAWTAHLPRQFVCQALDSAPVRSLITLAPLLGSALGSGVLIYFAIDIGIFALAYALAWLAFTLLLCAKVRRANTKAYAHSLDESETVAAAEVPPAGSTYWRSASRKLFTLGVLGTLFVDRTVRTLVLLEVVSFYPSMWGEDFFLLSLGSLAAALLASTRVLPPWFTSLAGCVTIFVLGGPGFFSWIWVETSCRLDMARCTPSRESRHIDMVLSGADICAGVLFLLELSYLQSPNEQPGPWSTLDFGSMVLLLASSVGRIISAWL